MKKRLVGLLLILAMLLGVFSLWSVAETPEETVISSITVNFGADSTIAGKDPFHPTLFAVNGDTALVNQIDSFYYDWYESPIDSREQPDQYTSLSTEQFQLGWYYSLYITVQGKYGYTIAPDCKMIALLPDGNVWEVQGSDYDADYNDISFDYLFDQTDFATILFDLVGYEKNALVKDAVVSVDSPYAQLGKHDGDDMYVFCKDNNGVPGTILTSPSATFEQSEAYWIYCTVTSNVIDLKQVTADKFGVLGGCEDVIIDKYDNSTQMLYLFIRLNRFEKPKPVSIFVDGYALGNQGVDVSPAVEAEDIDLTVGSGVPYALLYNSSSNNPGSMVEEDYIQPEKVYWLGIMLTNQTGDYSKYSIYDFTLNIPYTNFFIQREVEYMLVYFQLESFDYQSVPRLDFTLDGYSGGRTLNNATVSVEQKGFKTFDVYGQHYGFYYHDAENNNIGDFISESDASTLTFSQDQTVWLRVNVMPLYNTVFTPAPEVSLNLPYSQCLMVGNSDGSLDIAFMLEPVKPVTQVELEPLGYMAGQAITDFNVDLLSGDVEIFPGGYGDSFLVFADDQGEPGAILTSGVFEKNVTYWGCVQFTAKNGSSLTNVSEDAFSFVGITPTSKIGEHSNSNGNYYLFFQLPVMEEHSIQNVTTFTLTGYAADAAITDIYVDDDNEFVLVDPGYLYGYVILPEVGGIPDDSNVYMDGNFCKGDQYWLGIAITPAEGYSFEKVTGEYFALEGFEEQEVRFDKVSNYEAYVYFKLPPVQKEYTIILKFGESPIGWITVPEGSIATKPADPAQEGKVFLGWYTDDDVKYEFNTPVTQDISLTAKFEDATPMETQPIDQIDLMGAPLKYEVGKTIGEFAFDLTVPGNVTIFAADGEKVQTWVSSQYDVFSLLTIDEPPAPNALFASDKYYYVVTVLVADEGYRFAEGMVATINGQPATVEIITNEGVTLAYVAIGYDKATGMLMGTYNTNYAIDVVLNGYTIGGKVADAAVVGNSSLLEIVTFADEENFYILADKNGEPDYGSTVTEFAANTQYWLMVGLETAGGGDLAVTDVVPDKITCNGKPVDLMFDDDALMVVFKLPLLSDSTVSYGDVNGDSKVDATDALMVLQAAVGKITLTQEQKLAAEVDGQEGINAKDALEILKYAVHKIEKFPIEP